MELRADDPDTAAGGPITNLAGALARFRRFASPQIMASGLAVAVGARLTVAVAGTGGGAPGRWDIVAIAVVATLIPFVEWFIHLVVLHARPRRLGPIPIDPGIGHREHHLRPSSLNRVLLRGVDAAVFQAINAGVVLVVVGGPLRLLGAPVLGPVLTGIVAAIVGLLHYEWSHFLFHTAYRPKTRYYRRLKSNHRLHHWRNERYWLGVTSNAADRLLRTYPAGRSAVPLSATAKTLGVDPEPGQADTSTSGDR